jgi:hypothetical protein
MKRQLSKIPKSLRSSEHAVYLEAEMADNTLPDKLSFFYDTPSDRRTYHADGAQVGVTTSGDVYIAFYIERPWLPKKVVYDWNPPALGEVVEQETETGEAPGVFWIREIQASFIINPNRTTAIMQSLAKAVEIGKQQQDAVEKAAKEAAPK